jgi:hypothetical protein
MIKELQEKTFKKNLDLPFDSSSIVMKRKEKNKQQRESS